MRIWASAMGHSLNCCWKPDLRPAIKAGCADKRKRGRGWGTAEHDAVRTSHTNPSPRSFPSRRATSLVGTRPPAMGRPRPSSIRAYREGAALVHEAAETFFRHLIWQSVEQHPLLDSVRRPDRAQHLPLPRDLGHHRPGVPEPPPEAGTGPNELRCRDE